MDLSQNPLLSNDSMSKFVAKEKQVMIYHCEIQMQGRILWRIYLICRRDYAQGLLTIYIDTQSNVYKP